MSPICVARCRRIGERFRPCARQNATSGRVWSSRRGAFLLSLLVFARAFPFACVCFSQALSAPQLAQRAFPSVVMIVTTDANGQPLALGSGFFVRSGVIVTNLHVIKGATAASVKPISRPGTYEVTGVVGIDAAQDLALLRVKGLDAPPLQLGNSKNAAVGEQVFAVGNPEGLEGTFSEGIVSGIRAIGKNELLQISAPISPGSSGGPVIDSAGKVLGIAVATFKEGQNLNFAVPVSYLEKLLARSAGARVMTLAAATPRSSNSSAVAETGSAEARGVEAIDFAWGNCNPDAERCPYSFSLHNALAKPVRNISCLVVFKDSGGRPIAYDSVQDHSVIPPGLADRVDGDAPESVWEAESIEPHVGFSVVNFQVGTPPPPVPSPPPAAPLVVTQTRFVGLPKNQGHHQYSVELRYVIKNTTGLEIYFNPWTGPGGIVEKLSGPSVVENLDVHTYRGGWIGGSDQEGDWVGISPWSWEIPAGMSVEVRVQLWVESPLPKKKATSLAPRQFLDSYWPRFDGLEVFDYSPSDTVGQLGLPRFW